MRICLLCLKLGFIFNENYVFQEENDLLLISVLQI